jgi:predicted nucleic acid-binding protein
VNGKSIVIDSSVALKWRLRDEEATAQADALLDDFLAGNIHLLTPTLFEYEITNALKVAVMKDRLSETDALTAMEDFQGYDIELFAFSTIQRSAFQLACQYGRSVYDSAYLALAHSQGIVLYTGDKKLFNAVNKDLSWVRWIGDYAFEKI